MRARGLPARDAGFVAVPKVWKPSARSVTSVGLFVAFAFVACRPDPILPPPRPPVPGDDCGSAETRLRDLKSAGDRDCVRGFEPDGFAAFCRERAEAGIDLHGACIAVVDRCRNAEKASRGC